jgi:nucleotide-binding universal stress UspA family protein
MKILLATDGSTFSERAVNGVASRPWPAGSEIEVLFVVQSPIPDFPDPLLVLYSGRAQTLEHERKQGKATIEQAVSRLRTGGGSRSLEITTEVLEGSPKELIVDEAKRWGADLIVVGSHGRGAVGRLFLGSVSLAVATHAPCSVEIVR